MNTNFLTINYKERQKNISSSTQIIQSNSNFCDNLQDFANYQNSISNNLKTLLQTDIFSIQEQQEQRQSIPFKFGDVISLSPDDQHFKFIMSDGFVQTKIQVKNLEYDGNGQLFDRCLFRIYPKFSFNFQDIILANNQQKQYQNQESKKQGKLLKKVVNQQDLQNNIIQEYKNNIDLFQKIKGQEITFNQDIQLFHLASNKFLVCNYSESVIEKENFKLELQQFSSQNTIFRFINSYSYQIRSNGVVNINDLVYISCQNSYLGRIPYIRCSEIKKLQLINQIFSNQQKQYLNIPSSNLNQNQIVQTTDILTNSTQSITNQMRQTQTQKRRFSSNNLNYLESNKYNQEANVSLDQKSKWRILKYNNYEDDQNLLMYGDIIWLHHIEQANTLILKKIEQQLNVTIESATQREVFQKYEGNTNGMWVIENLNFQKGGKVNWDDIFLLRFIFQNKKLFISYNLETLLLDNIQILQFNLLFKIYFTQSNFLQNIKNYINKHKYVNKKGWIHIKEKQYYENQSLQHIKDEQLFNMIGKLIIQIRINQPLDEDAFKLYKATIAEIQEANFLVSCFPILKASIQWLKQLQNIEDRNMLIKELIKQDFEERFKTLNQCLNDVNDFCQNKIINISIEEQTLNFGKLNYQRQKLLTQLYYIDLITELLQNLLKEKELVEIMNIFQEERKQKFALKIKSCLKKQKVVKINIRKLEMQLMNKSKYYIEESENIIQEKANIFRLIQHQKNKTMKKYVFYLKQKYSLAQNAYKLMIQICKNNNENGKYVYSQKIGLIKFQSKYIKEAIDFIISIVGKNEFILNNLTDDIYLAERKKRNLISLQSLTISKQNALNQISVIQQELDFNQLNNNILLYFINSVLQLGSQNRNPNFLYFFRSICKFKGKGISVNQEIIYKFLQQKQTLEKCLFIPISINPNNHNQMFVFFKDNQKTLLDEKILGKDVSIYQNQQLLYFVEQIKLLSDLSLSRNYLWNDRLEKMFPLEYLINQVFNEKLHDEIRSAFCQLVSTVYVDHEPLNLLILPKMCRIYKSKYQKYNSKKQKHIEEVEDNDILKQFNLKTVQKNKTIFQQRQKHFEKLVFDCISFINQNINIIKSFNKSQDSKNKKKLFFKIRILIQLMNRTQKFYKIFQLLILQNYLQIQSDVIFQKLLIKNNYILKFQDVQFNFLNMIKIIQSQLQIYQKKDKKKQKPFKLFIIKVIFLPALVALKLLQTKLWMLPKIQLLELLKWQNVSLEWVIKKKRSHRIII
ncbi:MIR domain protein [Ichthyophthirius multifiliis]|uniref:MIR domain protein n=1 Tax=Ichthyophthirius multifiliis TaxID=5932 RepID=G0R3I8_ICHMU|nr:MIR domain protein [Ichthyophthirius multifiliis]EGR27977.1 MIR domain protein [Ichthyophthirius multifiliis]|eukprot:XP_004027322.1 MIR domain protein [Ichthyophthirius multifiliis]